MNSNDIFDIIGETPERYVLDAANVNAKVVTMRNRSPKRIWLIAAIVAMMLFLMGCAIVYVLSLEDMAFGKEVQEYYDGSSQELTLLSIQGEKGTPGYQATKEWYEWLETYDTDGAIRYSDEAYSEDFGDDYYAYNLYSREMKDKLDEICAKYGLDLLGRMYFDPDVEAGCKALQIQGIFRPDAQVEADFDNIRYYPNGSFDLEGHVQLQGYDRHIVSFSCHRKDAFTELYGGIGPEGTYEEWTYTTSYGVDILMVIETGSVRGHAFMMADRGPYVYWFSISESEDMPLPDKEGLEAYAEAFDFTAEPQRVSPEDLQAAIERRDEADAELNSGNYYMGFRINPVTQTWYPPEGYSDSFESYVPYIRENAPPENQYYTLLDIDGDGSEELLWGSQDGALYEVAVMQEGEVTLRFYDYLCDGNILLRELHNDEYLRDGDILEENCTSYEYSTLSELIVKLYYLPGSEQWIQVRPEQEDQVITEEEAKQIMEQYPQIELDMKPTSEYPS